jgi:3-deoxy-D-manno-octulosonate 8-phosphate phosphatase (KDO 8-P phosphatase)
MNKYKNFILDVDGVFTDGKFYYSSQGKIFKRFGDADNDALSLLKKYFHIEMITGDKRGFEISRKRIETDMKYTINLVSTFERADWIANRFTLENTIYMGDGIYDSLVFDKVGYSIAPINAFYKTKEKASFVTNAKGGEGAVAEACVHILESILGLDFHEVIRTTDLSSEIWSLRNRNENQSSI